MMYRTLFAAILTVVVVSEQSMVHAMIINCDVAAKSSELERMKRWARDILVESLAWTSHGPDPPDYTFIRAGNAIYEEWFGDPTLVRAGEIRPDNPQARWGPAEVSEHLHIALDCLDNDDTIEFLCPSECTDRAFGKMSTRNTNHELICPAYFTLPLFDYEHFSTKIGVFLHELMHRCNPITENVMGLRDVENGQAVCIVGEADGAFGVSLYRRRGCDEGEISVTVTIDGVNYNGPINVCSFDLREEGVHCYSVSDVRSLAEHYPEAAIYNAENYEKFLQHVHVNATDGRYCPHDVSSDTTGTVEHSDVDDIPDACDNCPTVSNRGPEGSEEVQVDTDGDMLGDACDLDPNTWNALQGIQCWWKQASYPGDCENTTANTTCITFADDYVWLITEDPNTEVLWESRESHSAIQTAVGTTNRYVHYISDADCCSGSRAERTGNCCYVTIRRDSDDPNRCPQELLFDGDRARCHVYPDPHFFSFHRIHYDYHGGCDLLLVRTHLLDGTLLEVHIRTEVQQVFSGVRNIAIQIGGQVLEVLPPEDPREVLLDGSTFQDAPEQIGGYGYDQSYDPDTQEPTYTITLSDAADVEYIQIKRSYQGNLDVEIVGHETDFGDAVGLCGNWNEFGLMGRESMHHLPDSYDPIDNYWKVDNVNNEFGEDWQIDTSDAATGDSQLFETAPGPNEVCQYPVDRMLRSSTARQLPEEAEEACMDVTQKMGLFHDCFFDVETTGDVDWATSPAYANPLEELKELCVPVDTDNECANQGGKCVWRCNADLNTCDPDLCTGRPDFSDPDGCACALPDREVGPCNPNPCLNGGTCSSSDDSYLCSCPSSFSGTDCEVDLTKNPCRPNPCQNGGTCSANNDSYLCSCPTNFSGTDCEVDLTEKSCNPNPCQNGGTCFANEDSYLCTCPTDFSGKNCEIVNEIEPERISCNWITWLLQVIFGWNLGLLFGFRFCDL